MMLEIEKKYRCQNAEVFYSRATITTVSLSDIEELVDLSSNNPRKRVRLCAHKEPHLPLHEMLIVHERSAYVRPHMHPEKTESMHIIAGRVDVVIFDHDGEVTQVIEMGEYASGLPFYYRLDTPAFHTLIIRSDVLVFHETTEGPFQAGASAFPAWAPDGANMILAESYVRDLDQRIKPLLGNL